MLKYLICFLSIIGVIISLISYILNLKRIRKIEKELEKELEKKDSITIQSEIFYNKIRYKGVSIYFKKVRDEEMKCSFTLDNIRKIIKQRETISAQNGDFIDRIILITGFNEKSRDLYVKLNDSKKHYKFHKVNINILKYSDNFEVNEFPFEDFEVNTFCEIENNKVLFEFIRYIKGGKII